MNILSELTSLIKGINIPVESGTFKDKAPETYVVLVPLNDSYPLMADDKPQVDYQECRITIYSKVNYLTVKRQITSLALANDFYISGRTYNGFEPGTSYYQYTIDVAKNYDPEEI